MFVRPHLLAVFLSVLLPVLARGQSIPQWTWVSGPNTLEDAGNYGVQGVAAASNLPAARRGGAVWTGKDGRVWLFGGANSSNAYFQDLWVYDPGSGLWTWVKGTSAVNQAGSYGAVGVASDTNNPGGRANATSWTDSQGRLWLFGGFGRDGAGNASYLSDLWRYDPSTNQWTWVKGANTVNTRGTYGTQGVAASNNVPGARFGAQGWRDFQGRLWLFGGYGYPAGLDGYLSDLWRYDPSTNQWTWVKGANTAGQKGVYGVQGTPDAGNSPGSRMNSVGWTDTQGRLCLFGGFGYDFVLLQGHLNDLWRFDPTTGQWTWIKGSNKSNQFGVYGTQGTAAPGNLPGGRDRAAVWTDAQGRIWMYGGFGWAETGVGSSALHDLWRFEPATNNWVWVRNGKDGAQGAVYGTQGESTASTRPGAKWESHSWVDARGRMWLWGGQGYSQSFGSGFQNDLWRLETELLPVVATRSASAVSDMSAILTADVNPNGNATVARFRIGTSPTLEGAVETEPIDAGSDTAPRSLSSSLTDLEPSTTYYYQAVADSSVGRGIGDILSFTTAIPSVNPIRYEIVAVINPGAPGQPRTPAGGLASDDAGNLYGVTYQGGAGDNGTIFRVNPVTGELTTLVEFSGSGGASRGQHPIAGLVNDGAGGFFGTTYHAGFSGGPGDYGSIFRYQPGTNTFTSLALFTGTSGAVRGSRPYAAMVPDGNGDFLGTTSAGGTGGKGVVYKVSAAGTVTTVADFASSPSPSEPYSPLLSDGAGGFLGSTRYGGAANQGSIYRVNPATGALTTLASFRGANIEAKGAEPYAGLVADGAGNFLGTAYLSGANGFGTVFKMNSAGTVTTLAQFTGLSGAVHGSYPAVGLTADGRGNFFGTTHHADGGGLGTVYKITASGAFTHLFDFTGTGGAVPGKGPTNAALLRHTDGNLYGMTGSGGPADAGVVFRIHFGPSVTTLPAAEVTQTGGTLQGTVNANSYPAKVGFEWGITPDVQNFTGYVLGASGNTSQGRSFVLSGLLPGTTYYYRIRAENSQNSAPQRGAVLSFTTAPVETLAATPVSFTKATLNARINPQGASTNAYFEYGPTPELGSSTEPKSIGNGNAVIEVSAEAGGFSPSSTVYFRAVESNSSGVQRGAVLSFQTRAALAPNSQTSGAEDLAPRVAGLTGKVTANGLETTASFEYGLTTTYGSVTPTSTFGPEDAGTSVKITAAGLAPHTTYHFRSRAVNAIGTAFGDDQTFTTLNTPPEAQSKTIHVPLTMLGALDLVSTDSDADGDQLVPTTVTDGAHGTVVIDGTKLRYQPAAGYTGNDVFTYTISDGFGGTSTATVTLRNQEPVAVDDVVHPHSSLVVIDVLSNGVGDSDPDNDPLSISGVTQGAHGTVVIDGMRVIYKPGESYNGNDSFTYTISDGHGGRDTATVTLQNELPLVAPETVVSNGEPVTFDPRGNDVDADGDTLQLVSVTQGSMGTVEIAGDMSSIIYTPGPRYFGRDAFTYTVTDGSTQVTATVVVRSSEPIVLSDPAAHGVQVPGQQPGTKYAGFGAPTVGAYFGYVQAGKARKQPAIFTVDGTVLLKAGDPAPGIAGAVIATLGQPSGQAVVARLKGPGISAKHDTVLYAGLADGSVRVAVREGDMLADGVVLKQISAIDGNGADVFFLAKLGGTSVRQANDTALGVALADGSVRLLTRKGDQVDGAIVTSIGTLTGSAGTLAEGRWRIGDSSIGVRLSFAGKAQALYGIPATANSPADWTRWARTGDSFAAISHPAVAQSFGLPGFAPGGVAFTTKLAQGLTKDVSVKNDQVLFRATLDGTVLLAREGSQVPGSDGTVLPGLTFKSFSDPVAGAAGRTAFTATLAGKGINATNRTGIWFDSGEGDVRMLARTGDAAPGGGRWASFDSLALPDGPASGPLIAARLVVNSADGVTPQNRQGLWGVDSSGTLRLLLRAGQTVEIGGVSRAIRSFVTLAPATGSFGTARSYDDDLHVTTMVTFDDRSTAILRIAVP